MGDHCGTGALGREQCFPETGRFLPASSFDYDERELIITIQGLFSLPGRTLDEMLLVSL
jgi:hypothetical protein